MIQHEGKGATKRLYVSHTYCTGRRALEEILILWTSFIVSGMPVLLLMLYNFFLDFQEILVFLTPKACSNNRVESTAQEPSLQPYTSLLPGYFKVTI